MESVYAMSERGMRALEDSGMTVRTILRILRLGMYAQVLLALWGTLSAQYGFIHCSALAVTLFGLMCLEFKTPRLLKIYAAVCLAMFATDVLWLVNYTGTIWSGRTGIRDQRFDSLTYASLNWSTLFPEFLAFLVRGVSSALWTMLWVRGALNDLQSEVMDLDGGGSLNQQGAYVPGVELIDDFSHVIPNGAVPEGRIRGQGSSNDKPSGNAPPDFSTYQQV